MSRGINLIDIDDTQTLTELSKTLNENYDHEDVIQQYLIDKAERKRIKRREKRKRKSQKRAMIATQSYQYILELDSGAVHQNRCPVLQGSLAKLKGFDTLKGSLKEGINLCPSCFGENISFDHGFTVKEKIRLIYLHQLCSNLKIKSKNQGRLFSMKTDVAEWYFIYGEGTTVLYHRNNIYPNNKKDFKKYHIQPVKFVSYEDMIQYIYKHDRKTISTYR